MSAPSVLIIGTGEYATGFVHGEASASDKSVGVIGLTAFDLRRRGKVGRVVFAGRNGTKFPAIREHFRERVAAVYRDMETSFDSFPADDVAADPEAYLRALATMTPGDAVIVVTPDDTHFPMALAAIEAGCNVLVVKPLVKTLDEHHRLLTAAERGGALVAVEVHKRWDPMYADAGDRIRQLGDLSYFYSYMSQPKRQLETFRAWAGRSSDISYYLNSHHVDFLVWQMQGRARAEVVSAAAASGVAEALLDVETEDAITLTVQWRNASGHLGVSVHAASWVAPTSDVHSQQRFHYMGTRGEIQIDQAHRGYSQSTDRDGYASVNPLFMKYAPDSDGFFAGQHAYGYRSIEAFIDAVSAMRLGAEVDSFHSRLALANDTLMETAILEAGRRSLDDGGRPQRIDYDGDGRPMSICAAA